MFITTNELAFTTQFMSPMSTGLNNCKCKSQIDNSSLNLTTIQVHDSCWNILYSTLSSGYSELVFSKKAMYLGMFMFSCDVYICNKKNLLFNLF